MPISSRNLLFAFLILLPSIVFSQLKPTNFILGTLPASGHTYSIPGYGNDYATNTTFTLNYGKQNANDAGFNRVVKTFKVESSTFTKSVSGTKPFREVVIKRSNTDTKVTALFETNATSKSSGSTLYLTPDYINTMENLANSYIINRGTDNIFVNSATTDNTIERIDLILENAIDVSKYNPQTSGFLFMERGGNDKFKVSAITGISGNNATALNTPVTIQESHWGTTNQNINSIVMQKKSTDVNLKPSQFIPSQPISGVFVTLAQLGMTSGSIYGIGLFGADVNLNNTDLLNISKYPTNTPDNNGNGLDFMAGGGFFTKAILIQGEVWKDTNENAEKAEGRERGVGNGMWANLVDPSGKVVSSVQVNSEGTYALYIASNNTVQGNYKVILTNEEKQEGSTLSDADLPLNGFYYTGTNVNGSADQDNKTGIINIGGLYHEDLNDIKDVTGINFGIQNPALPIGWGSFSANIVNNQFQILWSTLYEQNNSYFEIETSTNGTHFVKVGTVQSKAINGNSDMPVDYEFTIDLSQGFPIAIASILPIALLSLAFRRRQKWFFATVAIITTASIIGTSSCAKKEISDVQNGTNIFVRLKQVNKDGSFEYSKAIQAIKK
ncbi:MAG: hypothetical protein QM727_10890 [Niabella sp.]